MIRIPLQPNRAFQRLRTELSDILVEIEIRYQTRLEYFVVNVRDVDADQWIIQGAGAHPEMDILEHDRRFGRLYFQSKNPVKISNIARSAHLMYEE